MSALIVNNFFKALIFSCLYYEFEKQAITFFLIMQVKKQFFFRKNKPKFVVQIEKKKFNDVVRRVYGFKRLIMNE